MSLRKKTLLIISATILGLVIILSFISRITLNKQIAEMEEQKTKETINYFLGDLENEYAVLEALVSDWGAWDDSYEFVTNLNDKYKHDNLMNPTFEGIKCNLIMFFDAKGKIVFAKAVDLEQDKEIPVPKGVFDYFTPDNKILYYPPGLNDDNDDKEGILLLPEFPLAFASHPILTSEKKGPMRGTVLMGKFINPSLIKRLSSKSTTKDIKVSIQRLDSIKTQPQFKTILPHLTKENSVCHDHKEKDFVSAYTLVNDYFNKPILLLKIDIPYQEFTKNLNNPMVFVLYVILIGAIFGIIKILFLEKLVLARLAKLSNEVDSIGTSGNLSYRVTKIGNDELAHLAFKINKTLDALESSNNTLRESERKFRESIENVELIVLGIDLAGKVNLFNKEAIITLGYKIGELTGKYFQTFLAPEQLDLFNSYLKTSIEEGYFTKDFECFLVTQSGERRSIIWNTIFLKDSEGNINGAIGFGKDITERKKLEEELFKMRTIESLGIFAGGIAHDFNNLLMGVLGNISVAKIHSKNDTSTSQILEEAEKAIARAKDLTQQLLTFSKTGTPIKKRVHINDLIKDSVTFILRGSNIKCEFDLPERPIQVDIDEGQINQVINNLIINAVQAMPDGGTIYIQCDDIELNKQHTIPLPNGRYEKIAIKDEGTGIPIEILSKIFDPYFTTKPTGNGLGLSMVFSIIKHHGGYITAESKEGIGTTFCIYLPVSTKNATPIPEEIIVIPEVKSTPKMGQGKVLVMDDEAIVRQVSGLMLKELGYKADFAKDGVEAIEMYQKAMEANTPFDIVIMDLTIPGGMGGKECIKFLLKINPNVKAIVSSGYSSDSLEDFKNFGFCGCVNKPYKLDELSNVLSEVFENIG